MKLTVSTVAALLLVSRSQAFAPPYNSKQSFRTSSLSAENLLEGRKIGGEVKPINDFVLVKTLGEQESTDAGILLTGSAKVTKTEGKVVAVGPGRTHPESGRLFTSPLEEGDSVVYGEYDGTEIDLNGETHMLIRNDNVLVKYVGDKLLLDAVEVVGDCILVEIDDDEQSTAGGVLLAAASKTGEKRPSTGTIVKVGEGKMAGDGTMIPITVSVGDKIKFLDFAGNEIEIEGEEYSVVRMGEVMAKF